MPIYNSQSAQTINDQKISPVNYLTNSTAELTTAPWATYALAEAVTFQDTGDTVTLAAHGLTDGTAISFSVITSTTGISINTLYYVVGSTTNTFQVATTVGGTALPLTTNGTGTLLRSVPVTGTGGTPSVTFIRQTTSPIANSAMFQFVKDAANRMGQGSGYPFTIAAGDQGKMLQIGAMYSIASGTYVTGDVTMYIYDVTNNRIIQPSGFQVENVGVISNLSGTFQTAINSTSYRLCFHVATVSAIAYTLNFTRFTLGPQVVPLGAPVTDWVSYTPTGSWVTNSTYSGRWRRVGDHLEYQIRVALSGAPTATSLTINHLPAGLSVDTAKIPGTNTNGGIPVGVASMVSGGSAFNGSAYYNGANIAVVTSGATSSYTSAVNVNATIPATFATNDYVEVKGSTPISGWSSSTVVSSSADTRVVASSRNTLSSTTITLNTALNFTTLGFDTTGSFSSATTYTVPVPGIYRVTATGFTLASGTANLNVRVNGVDRALLTAIGTARNSGSAVINVIAGDALTIVSDTSVTASSTAAIAVYIERISGPSQIAASEVIACRYTNTAATVYGNGPTTVTIATRDYDTHNAFASNTFTAPAPGFYYIRSQVRGSANQVSTAELRLEARKNASTSYLIAAQLFEAAGNQNYTIGGSCQLSLLAGETVDIRFTTTFSGNVTASTTDNQTYVEIHRIGGVM
jgi:hypothetical protein